MPTRNTAILNEIVDVLGRNLISPLGALAELEEHFNDKLVMIVASEAMVNEQADQLRLAIINQEAAVVLDYIAEHQLVTLNIETTDEVINALFPNRFIEP